jgi:hypothetical protein
MLSKDGFHKTTYIKHLLNGKFTKHQIATKLAKKFKMKKTTARRTTDWQCSMIKKQTGLPANYKRPII